MTAKQIAKKVTRRKNRIRQLQSEIAQIQENCPHQNLLYSFGGSTGSWDREDSFWIDFYCKDCEKRWQTDQSRENLALTDHATKMNK